MIREKLLQRELKQTRVERDLLGATAILLLIVVLSTTDNDSVDKNPYRQTTIKHVSHGTTVHGDGEDIMSRCSVRPWSCI